MPEYKRPKDIFDLLDRMAGADLSLPERSVLVQQYKYADKDGRNSYVSEAQLAKDLFTTDKNIRNHRAKLRTKGWLIERARGKNLGGGDKASVYEVVVPLFQKPATRVRRKANNAAGWNQHRKNPSCEPQEDLTSNASSPEEESFHLPTYRGIDAERASNHLVVVDRGAGAQSGCAGAHREAEALASGSEPSGQHVAGSAKSAAPVSNANDFRPHEDRSYEDPWGAAPSRTRNENYEPRHDLAADVA